VNQNFTLEEPLDKDSLIPITDGFIPSFPTRSLDLTAPLEPTEEPGAKLRRLTKTNEYKGPIKKIQPTEPLFNSIERANISKFADIQRSNGEIIKAISVSPDDVEWVLGEAPPLEFTKGPDGNTNGVTDKSMEERSDFLRATARQIIDKASTDRRVQLPIFDELTGQKLQPYSPKRLKAAMEFLSPKPQDKIYREIGPLISFAVSKQKFTETAEKWKPGGIMFESVFSDFIGQNPGQFKKEELVEYFERLLAEQGKQKNYTLV
jgi:hypothetical protein